MVGEGVRLEACYEYKLGVFGKSRYLVFTKTHREVGDVWESTSLFCFFLYLNLLLALWLAFSACQCARLNAALPVSGIQLETRVPSLIPRGRSSHWLTGVTKCSICGCCKNNPLKRCTFTSLFEWLFAPFILVSLFVGASIFVAVFAQNHLNQQRLERCCSSKKTDEQD